MKGDSLNHEEQLSRLVDALVNDILNASDEEVLAEAQDEYGDAEKVAAEVDELINKAKVVVGKQKLAAARAEVNELGKPALETLSLSFEDKKAILKEFAESDEGLTLAARKGKGLAESDVDAALQALYELGVIDKNGNRK